MNRILKLKNGLEISIKDAPFASGGEGELFEIVMPLHLKDQVVKLYKVDKRTAERENKITYLVNNPPKIAVKDGHHSVVWAKQIVYEKNKFAGFTMPKASGEKLELLCHIKLPVSLSSSWRKYAFEEKNAIENRQKLCFNIAVAIQQIHSFGNYVLVDMKPENILVQPNGLVSIIDTDSIEIISNNKVVYKAPVATPDYIPPEYYKGVTPDKTLIAETWDRFSLAIMFYRLLCGIHPFIGTCHQPFDKFTDVSSKIEHGLFPFGKNKHKFRVIPSPHQQLLKLAEGVRNNFIQCFDEGHSFPDRRPSANDWCQMLAPQSVLIPIHRKLPSVSFNGKDLWGKSKEAPTPLLDAKSVMYKKPKIIQLKKASALRVAWDKMFGVSVKQVTINKIVSVQDRWPEIESEIKVREYELSRLKQQYNVLQADVFTNETRQLQALKAEYIRESKALDKAARNLFAQELALLTQIEETKRQLLSARKSYLQYLYNNTIDPLETQINSLKSKYSSQINTILDAEANEVVEIEKCARLKINQINIKIKQLERSAHLQSDQEMGRASEKIEAKRKEIDQREQKALAQALERHQNNFITSQLSQYSIRKDAYTIFDDQHANPDRIANYLAKNGILTAADFTSVNSTGKILTKAGLWVKVSDVGVYRAEKLERWRQAKLRNSPITVPQSLPLYETLTIKSEYNKMRDQLQQEEAQTREAALRKLGSNPQALGKARLLLNDELKKTEKEEKLAKEKIKEKYHSKREEYNNNFRSIIDSLNKEILQNKTEFERQRQIKFEEENKYLKKLLTDREQVIRQFDIHHEPLLRRAGELFASVEVRVGSLRMATKVALNHNHSNTSEQFKRKVQELDISIENANRFVEELSFLQFTYSQLK